MEKEGGLEEVDVYRSSHTNSCFNKRIAEGITYTFPPYVQRGAFGVCRSTAVCALHVEKREMTGSHNLEKHDTSWRVLMKGKMCQTVLLWKRLTFIRSFFLQCCTIDTLNHSSTQCVTLFRLYQGSIFSFLFSLCVNHFSPL